jgi:hypothetical protein
MTEKKINPRILFMQLAAVIALFILSQLVHNYYRSKKKMISEMSHFETRIVRSSIDHGWLTLNDTILVYGLSRSRNAYGNEVQLKNLALPFVLVKSDENNFFVIHEADTLIFPIEYE